MISAYYKFALLPDEVRAINKINSVARRDCIAYSSNLPNGYSGLTNFVNKKGQLYLFKTPANQFVKAESKRVSEWSLTNGLNFSSIYIENFNFSHVGYGYPNAKRLLANGLPNPLFLFRNDGYLFLFSPDLTEIEVLIIVDGRNLIGSYYHKLIDGDFEEELNELRQKAKPYFNYALPLL